MIARSVKVLSSSNFARRMSLRLAMMGNGTQCMKVVFVSLYPEYPIYALFSALEKELLLQTTKEQPKLMLVKGKKLTRSGAAKAEREPS